MMKTLFNALLVWLLVFVIPSVTIAEIYLGIGPRDNLATLRKKFPNANFNKEKPAWGEDIDELYSITGQGISGNIVVLLNDYYELWKRQVEKEPDTEKRKAMTEMPSPSADNEVIRWVRWIPDSPFPATRLIAKYGKPEISDFSSDDYRPYKEWKKRGVRAYLTDDSKKVLGIDFTFTAKERSDASIEKFGIDFTGYKQSKKQPKKK